MTPVSFCRSAGECPLMPSENPHLHHKLVTNLPASTSTRSTGPPQAPVRTRRTTAQVAVIQPAIHPIAECSILLGAPQPDTAAGRPRVQAGAQPCCAEPVEHSLEQVQVHAADQLGVLLCHGVERTVVQHDVAAVHPRFVALCLQHVHQRVRALPVVGAGLLTSEDPTHLTCPPVEDVAGGLTASLDLDERA